MPDMHVTEKLLHATVRIEAQTESGVCTGSGFFFEVHQEEGKIVTVIATNRHVVQGAGPARVYVSTADENGNIQYGAHFSVDIPDLAQLVTYHPSSDIDLAAIRAAPILQCVLANDKTPFFITIDEAALAKQEDLNKALPISDVLMVGYPNGIWDGANNLPIVRRGVTATPVYTDFQGRAEFVIDCACFPGSSGSPVFLYSSGFHMTRSSNDITMGGMKISLAGVLYAGPQHVADGQVVVRPIPTRNEPIAVTSIPNNLGYCIKAHELRKLRKHIQERFILSQV